MCVCVRYVLISLLFFSLVSQKLVELHKIFKMKRRRPSGFQQRKVKNEREQVTRKMSALVFQLVDLPPTSSTTGDWRSEEQRLQGEAVSQIKEESSAEYSSQNDDTNDSNLPSKFESTDTEGKDGYKKITNILTTGRIG